MAEKFKPQTFDINSINGGDKFNLGDGISPEAVNAPIEAAAFIQGVHEKHSFEIGLLFSIAEQTNQFYKATVEDEFVSRVTAGGLNVVDKSPAIVQEIKGKTVVTDSGLANAFFNSIKSTGRNLLPYPFRETTKTINGVTFTDNGDGTVTANGTATAQAYLTLWRGKLPIGDYFLSGKTRDGVYTNIMYIANSNYSFYKADQGGGVKFTIATEEELSIALSISSGNTVSNLVFKPMLNIGETALPFEPYTENTYQLPYSVELGEWDIVYPQTGEIVIQTGTAIKQTEFTEEEISSYDSAIVATDKLSLAYKLAQPRVTKIDAPKYYMVESGGTETVIQGTTDNSSFGANPTITNQYFVLGGKPNES